MSEWLGWPASVADSEHAALRRLVLVDAATRAELADLTGGDAAVDFEASAARSFDIVAEVSGNTASVGLALTGPRTAAHTSDFAPHTLFGTAGGGLGAGDYAVAISSHRTADDACEQAGTLMATSRSGAWPLSRHATSGST